ncbi:pentatricopeptide repeat-containing protein [Pyrus ussuriensis x Pyrus communis]|uniref:Pentatricopeptide repeat-containing protein n=1 Tax=Pyrus ussuriensis x Pyrus communis TaxID=2448454 RepID=A0A5N5GRN9_9ROSA|nr:pentatricopeptide repeat-containing protein [Pyrus ussuriensis x Pyrus communis]
MSVYAAASPSSYALSIKDEKDDAAEGNATADGSDSGVETDSEDEDRENVHAVLDECDIHLSHDLVAAVLKRFQHARKPALRFFYWEGQKPGFSHDSRTPFAATNERNEVVGIFELMKYYKFKVGVNTINCLLDTFGRAKLGKKMQLLFEKLK